MIFSLKLGILMLVAVLVLTQHLFAEAYDATCPSVTAGIAVAIDGRNLTFSNTSTTCRQIGVAVYKLFSAASRSDSFYYSKTFGLRAGKTVTFAAAVPPCAYVIDAVVGEPMQTVKSQADYGGRLLVERVVTNAPYCPVAPQTTLTSPVPNIAGASTSAQPNTNTTSVPPLPKIKQTPSPTPAPLPTGRVYGTSTSTVQVLDLATGSNAMIPLALFGSVVLSGAVMRLRKKSFANR